MGIKSAIYSIGVDSNPDVKREYEQYVREHIDEHKKSRLKHWGILWKLNVHYRIKKKNTPLIYQDVSENRIISAPCTTIVRPVTFGLKLGEVQTNSADIMWEKAPNVKEYRIFLSGGGRENHAEGKTSNNFFRIKKLMSETGYSVSVQGIYENGDVTVTAGPINFITLPVTADTSKEYSQTDNVILDDEFMEEPYIPVIRPVGIKLAVKETDTNIIKLAWKPVSEVCAYRVFLEGGGKKFHVEGRTENTAFNIKKLKSDTEYNVYVQGIYENGDTTETAKAVCRTKYPLSASPNPYTDGPESDAVKRRTVYFLAKELMQYDVISFDIFDTLILRPFKAPRDMFMMLDGEFDMLGFARLRQNAETRVREIAGKTKGNREVTIYDIYREIGLQTGIDPEEGVKKEFELEKKLCMANPYMKELFDLLYYGGKRIIIVSDMYFPEEMLSELLESCGYSGWEKLFVSCDHNTNKYSKTLYADVKRYLGKGLKCIHIGDDKKADITAAEECGFDTFYYPSCAAIGNKYRASQYGMSDLIGSAYSGIINTMLHNGLSSFSVYYEYGFIYGGLYVYGFCSRIHKRAKELGLKKILFLARDGYIYKKVYDMLYDDIPSEYAMWSRNANSWVAADHQRDIFLKRYVDAKSNYELKTSIADLIENFGLWELEAKLKKYGIKSYQEINPQNANTVKTWLTDNWSTVLEALDKENVSYEKYYRSLIGSADRVALIDTGWQGSTLLGLKWAIEDKWKLNCRAYCFMAGSQTANPIVNQAQLLNGEIETYLFNISENRFNYLFHQKKYPNSITSFLFEMFTQAPHPTFSGFRDGKFEFGIPEIENYDIIREIQDGIMDFCKEYSRIFGSFDYMNNISGHDAYVPFMFIAKEPRYFKNFFMDFTYSKATGGDNENQKTEDMRLLFQKAKI